MSTLGSFAKGLAFVLGKQPEDEQRPRGFLGLEWIERVESGRTEVEISRVLTGSPAEAGGLQAGRPHPQDQPPRDRGPQERPRGACRSSARRHSGHGRPPWLGQQTSTNWNLTLTVGEGL